MPSGMSRNPLSAWVLCLGFVLLPLRGAEAAFTSEPDLQIDSHLELALVLDGKASSVSGVVTATLRSDQPGTLDLMRREPLPTQNPAGVLDRGSISADSGVILSPNQSRDIRITVQNVLRSGTFKVNVVFGLKGTSLERTVSVTVTVTAKPDAKPLKQSYSFQMARIFVARSLIERILPAQLGGVERAIALENTGRDPIDVTAASAVWLDSKIGTSVVTKDLIGGKPLTIGQAAVQSFGLELDPSLFRPGHYDGSATFILSNLDQPVLVSLGLDVRSGPWPAVAAIFLGVVLGRIVQVYSSPAVQQRVQLLDRLANLRYSVRTVADDRTRALLFSRVDDLTRRTNWLEIPEQDVATLEHVVAGVLRVEALRTAANRLPAGALAQSDEAKIDAARDAFLNKDLVGAESLIDQIQRAIGAGATKHEVPLVKLMDLRPIRELVQFDAPQEGTEKPQAKERAPSFVASFFGVLSGSTPLPAWIARAWIRPFLFALLLLVLGATGFVTLYIGGSTTFGSGGVFDYLPLLLWGLGADVAQRTLQNIPLPRPA